MELGQGSIRFPFWEATCSLVKPPLLSAEIFEEIPQVQEAIQAFFSVASTSASEPPSRNDGNGTSRETAAGESVVVALSLLDKGDGNTAVVGYRLMSPGRPLALASMDSVAVLLRSSNRQIAHVAKFRAQASFCGNVLSQYVKCSSENAHGAPTVNMEIVSSYCGRSSDRPILQAAVVRAAQPAGVLVASEVGRISRNPSEIHQIVDLISCNGGSVLVGVSREVFAKHLLSQPVGDFTEVLRVAWATSAMHAEYSARHLAMRSISNRVLNTTCPIMAASRTLLLATVAQAAPRFTRIVVFARTSPDSKPSLSSSIQTQSLFLAGLLSPLEVHAIETAAGTDGISCPDSLEELAAYKAMAEQSSKAQACGQSQVVLLAVGLDRIARKKELLEQLVRYGRQDLDPPVFVCVAFPPAVFWRTCANGREAFERALADAPSTLRPLEEDTALTEAISTTWDAVVLLQTRVATTSPAALGFHFIGPKTFKLPWFAQAMACHQSFLMTFGAYLHVREECVEPSITDQRPSTDKRTHAAAKLQQRSRGMGLPERRAVQASFLRTSGFSECQMNPALDDLGGKSGRSLSYYRCSCASSFQEGHPHDASTCRCRCVVCRRANQAYCPHGPERCTWAACPCTCDACHDRDRLMRRPLLSANSEGSTTMNNNNTKKKKTCKGGCPGQVCVEEGLWGAL